MKFSQLFHSGVSYLNKIIPGVVSKGQYISKILIAISKLLVNTTESEKITTFCEGMITGMLCNDAQTGLFHYEKDCSYTIICIPYGHDFINSSGNFVFQFKWREGKYISIQLN